MMFADGTEYSVFELIDIAHRWLVDESEQEVRHGGPCEVVVGRKRWHLDQAKVEHRWILDHLSRTPIRVSSRFLVAKQGHTYFHPSQYFRIFISLPLLSLRNLFVYSLQGYGVVSA